jgi:hypothetical protein
MNEDDILKQIEFLAGLFFTIEEISIRLNINETELRREIRGKISPRAQAYIKGKMDQILELRKELINYAKRGSNQADTIVTQLINKQKQAE